MLAGRMRYAWQRPRCADSSYVNCYGAQRTSNRVPAGSSMWLLSSEHDILLSRCCEWLNDRLLGQHSIQAGRYNFLHNAETCQSVSLPYMSSRHTLRFSGRIVSLSWLNMTISDSW